MSIRPILERAQPLIFKKLGETVIYRPLTGPTAEIMALVEYTPGQSDAFSVGVQTPTTHFVVRAADIESPQEGDVIEFDSTDYTVCSVTKTEDRFSWRLFVQDAS